MKPVPYEQHRVLLKNNLRIKEATFQLASDFSEFEQSGLPKAVFYRRHNLNIKYFSVKLFGLKRNRSTRKDLSYLFLGIVDLL